MTTDDSVSARVATHLDHHLGRSSVVRNQEATEDWRPFRLVRYQDQPVPGSSTVVSVGLSEIVLSLAPGVIGRQELAMSAYDAFVDARITELIQILAALVRGSEASERGWFPGTVLPFAGPVLDGLPFETLYSADISYLDADARLVKATDPMTNLAWLVPIFGSEVAFISNRGFRAFEQLLMRSDPAIDLLDFTRQPVIAP